MEEVKNLTGLKTLKIAYNQRRDLLNNLKLIDVQMAKDNIEACSGLKVSTYVPEVSTHKIQKCLNESTLVKRCRYMRQSGIKALRSRHICTVYNWK